VLEGRRVAVVIPAYRVAPFVREVITDLPTWIDQVLVVDDGSPDDTAGVVERLGDPRVVLLRHTVNRGLGAAMATGYAKALELDAAIVVKMDGDGQMDPAALPLLLDPLLRGQADYAKGDRFWHGAELVRMPRPRLVGNLLLTFLTKLSSGCWNVFDPQNGYVAITADMLRQIDLAALDQGYFFENEMLIQLNILSARIADVPIPARYRGEVSSLRPAWVLPVFAARLVLGLGRRLVEKYVLREFSPVAMLFFPGMALFLAGLAFGVYHWGRSVRSGVPATAGTVILAMLPVALGFQLLLHALLLDIGNASPPWRSAGVGRRHMLPRFWGRTRPRGIESGGAAARASVPAPPPAWLDALWIAWAGLLLVPLMVQAYYDALGAAPPGEVLRRTAIVLGIGGVSAAVAVTFGGLGRLRSPWAVGGLVLAVLAGAALLSGEAKGWLGAAALLLLALAPGRLVARLCGRGEAPILLVLALGLALFALAAFVASLAHGFSLALFAAMAVAAWVWASRLGPSAPPMAPGAADGEGLDRGERAGVGFLTGLLAIVMLQASVPEFEFDAFWAHLPLARAIAERRYEAIPEVWWTMIPHAHHMLSGIAYKLGGLMGAKLLHPVFLVLSVGWAVWLGARLYGLASGLAAGALFLTIPLVMWEGTTGNSDLGATFFAVGGVAALLEFLRRGGTGWLFIVGLMVGTAIAIKYFAGAMLLPLGLILLIEKIRRGPGLRLVQASLLVAVGVAVGAGPWLLRTALLTGNPVFPVFNYYFESPYWGTQRQNMDFAGFGYPWSLRHVLMLPLRLTFETPRFGQLPHGAVAAFPLLWLPLLLARWRVIGREGGYLLLVAAGYSAGVLAVAQYLRYLLPAWLILAVVLGGALGVGGWLRGTGRGRVRRIAIVATLLGALGHALFAWLALYPPRALALPLLTGKIRKQEYLETNVWSVGALQALEGVVPRDATVLLYAGDHTLYATLYAKRYLIPPWAEQIKAVFYDERPLPREQALEILRRHRIRYVLVEAGRHRHLLDLGITRPVFVHPRATLYEVVDSERAPHG
jgi:4-amino-4-deoxy-L-arabinose transferase-like glycosyltransferase